MLLPHLHICQLQPGHRPYNSVTIPLDSVPNCSTHVTFIAITVASGTLYPAASRAKTSTMTFLTRGEADTCSLLDWFLERSQPPAATLVRPSYLHLHWHYLQHLQTPAKCSCPNLSPSPHLLSMCRRRSTATSACLSIVTSQPRAVYN